MSRRLLPSMAALAVIAAAILVGVGVHEPKRVAVAYLVGWLTATSAVLGMLLVVLVAHCIAVRWIVVVRRLAENVTAILPWLALGMVPLFVMAHQIYPWANGDVPEHLRNWLSLPWVIARSIIYFAIWIGVAEIIRYHAQRTPSRIQYLAGGAIPVYGITLTCASFDWVMSLMPRWVSTMYGVYMFAAGFVTAFAVLAILAWAAEKSGSLAGRINPSHYHAIGRMLYAFVIFWTYIGFDQFFIIHMADLPEEAIWVVQRLTPYWLNVTLLLLFVHFVLPFALLSTRESKRRGGYLAAVSALVVVAHALDMAYLVLPSVGFTISWLDVVACIACIASSIAVGMWRTRHVPVIPDNDPLLAASLRYVS